MPVAKRRLLPSPPAFQLYCISGRTVLQFICDVSKSAVIDEAALGTSLAQCVRNHHTLNLMCLWHKKQHDVLSLQDPSPLVLQLFISSLLRHWQVFGKSSLLPSPALFTLLLSTRSPVLSFCEQPSWGFASSECFLFSMCMTEINVTVALSVLATFSPAAQEILLCIHWWYG